MVEALRARVPATALYVATGLDRDERITEALAVAGKRGITLLEVTRAQLDRMTQGALHQGVALQVPPYTYADPDDLLARALEAPGAPLFVALDGVTDPGTWARWCARRQPSEHPACWFRNAGPRA